MSLSSDTSPAVAQTQIDLWRRMSSLEKAALITRATEDAMALALAGIRLRYPAASERECFLRLAELRLGHALVRQAYPDAKAILDGPV